MVVCPEVCIESSLCMICEASRSKIWAHCRTHFLKPLFCTWKSVKVLDHTDAAAGGIDEPVAAFPFLYAKNRVGEKTAMKR